jgi:hypothetical protein
VVKSSGAGEWRRLEGASWREGEGGARPVTQPPGPPRRSWRLRARGDAARLENRREQSQHSQVRGHRGRVRRLCRSHPETLTALLPSRLPSRTKVRTPILPTQHDFSPHPGDRSLTIIHVCRSPPPNLSTPSSVEQWNRSPVSSKQPTPQASPRMDELPMMRKQKYSMRDVAMPPRSVGRNGRRSSRLEKQVSIDRRRGSLSPIAEPESDGGGRAGSGSPRGPRLFSEVFALGCSIAFRWASVSALDPPSHRIADQPTLDQESVPLSTKLVLWKGQ